MTDLTQHLSAVLLHDGAGITLKRVAERVVRGEEEPGIATRRHEGFAGAVGQSPGVIGPMNGVGCALRPGQVGRARPGGEKDLIFVFDDVADGERYRRSGNVYDDVDLVDIDP